MINVKEIINNCISKNEISSEVIKLIKKTNSNNNKHVL